MPKLCETRSSNLSSPLTGEEVGYTFNFEKVNSIINIIDKEIYGSYLIGGIVGTGKSSLVDIAAAYSKKKLLTIHINFYNENEIIEKFSSIVMEYLIDEIEKEIKNMDEDLSELVMRCKNRLNYSINRKIDKTDTKNNGENHIKKERFSIFSKIGFSIHGNIASTATTISGKKSMKMRLLMKKTVK